MHAIPTTYAGVNFRSRLEARWAAMFDLLGWRWEYEPIDLAGYIPDFVLGFQDPVLVEIKPALSERACRAAEAKFAAADPAEYVRTILGAGFFLVGGVQSCGLLDNGMGGFGGAQIRRCRQHWTLATEFGNWRCLHVECDGRPGRNSDDMSPELVALWRTAGNHTQWKPHEAPVPALSRDTLAEHVARVVSFGRGRPTLRGRASMLLCGQRLLPGEGFLGGLTLEDPSTLAQLCVELMAYAETTHP